MSIFYISVIWGPKLIKQLLFVSKHLLKITLFLNLIKTFNEKARVTRKHFFATQLDAQLREKWQKMTKGIFWEIFFWRQRIESKLFCDYNFFSLVSIFTFDNKNDFVCCHSIPQNDKKIRCERKNEKESFLRKPDVIRCKDIFRWQLLSWMKDRLTCFRNTLFWEVKNAAD